MLNADTQNILLTHAQKDREALRLVSDADLEALESHDEHGPFIDYWRTLAAEERRSRALDHTRRRDWEIDRVESLRLGYLTVQAYRDDKARGIRVLRDPYDDADTLRVLAYVPPF